MIKSIKATTEFPGVRRVVELEVNSLHFPAGELLVRLNDEPLGLRPSSAVIDWAYTDDSDIMELLLVTDALRRKYRGIALSLQMDYVPYARQDRVCNSGESHSLRVFADLINAQNYASVTCLDPHSDVVGAVFNNLRIVTAVDYIREVLTHYQELPVFIIPDAGAQKRVRSILKELASWIKETFGSEIVVVSADKIREPASGEIVGMQVHEAATIHGRDALIIDDICDGGRSFSELAKALRPFHPRTIALYVSHGIFSHPRGVRALTSPEETTPAQHINTIYVANYMSKEPATGSVFKLSPDFL